jgi:GxxExxY protein
MYLDHDVGTVRLDMIVNNEIIIEFKAIKKITNKEIKQLENYLRITKMKTGYLINIGLDGYEVIEVIGD